MAKPLRTNYVQLDIILPSWTIVDPTSTLGFLVVFGRLSDKHTYAETTCWNRQHVWTISSTSLCARGQLAFSLTALNFSCKHLRHPQTSQAFTGHLLWSKTSYRTSLEGAGSWAVSRPLRCSKMDMCCSTKSVNGFRPTYCEGNHSGISTWIQTDRATPCRPLPRLPFKPSRL